MKHTRNHIGLNAFITEVTESTNCKLLTNHEKFRHGDVFQALRQTEGKGRQNRHWYSDEGGLYFSVILKNTRIISDAYPLILLAAFAVVRTMQSYYPSADFKIKWPNDIFFKDKKICGILSESQTQNNVSHVVIGIGINVNNSVGSLRSLRHPAVSLSDIAEKYFSLADVLDTFLDFYDEFYDTFLTTGLSPFLSEMNSLLYCRNKTVSVSTVKGKKHIIPKNFMPDGSLLCLIDRHKICLNMGELD